MMRVTILNHSDVRGGASVASYRLMQALRDAGHDARMLVMHKATQNPNVEVLQPAWRRKAAFLAEHLEIYLRNGFSRANLFKASTASWGMAASEHPWVREADAVVLSWVNQGMLSLSEIARIKAPVAWAMHDMWCLTGVCHHAGECARYKQVCGGCPLLHRRHLNSPAPMESDLSTSTQRRKMQLYAEKPIRFVAVSNWLARRSRMSAAMEGQQVATIPNAFPVEDFYIQPQRPRADLGLPEGTKLIVMGAARLDDDIKGLPLAIEALNQVRHPEATAVFFGALKNPRALDSLRLPHVHLGPLDEDWKIRELYAHASVVLSSSHYETLPTTLIEGMAAGCVPVTFGQGGQADIVDHGVTGYIARYPDASDLAYGINYSLHSPPNPETLRSEITRRFSAASVAEKWERLLLEMTSENNNTI